MHKPSWTEKNPYQACRYNGQCTTTPSQRLYEHRHNSYIKKGETEYTPGGRYPDPNIGMVVLMKWMTGDAVPEKHSDQIPGNLVIALKLFCYEVHGLF
jgi:hypothetical protein